MRQLCVYLLVQNHTYTHCICSHSTSPRDTFLIRRCFSLNSGAQSYKQRFLLCEQSYLVSIAQYTLTSTCYSTVLLCTLTKGYSICTHPLSPQQLHVTTGSAVTVVIILLKLDNLLKLIQLHCVSGTWEHPCCSHMPTLCVMTLFSHKVSNSD